MLVNINTFDEINGVLLRSKHSGGRYLEQEQRIKKTQKFVILKEH
jgi:hypothetical protein